MSLRHYYLPSWGATETPVEFTDNVRLYTFDMAENAEEGSVATSAYVVDDPEGVLDFPPLVRIWSEESEVASSSNTTVHHGYVADRAIRRGDSTLTSAARVWEISVADENSILSRRVLSNTNANRPAETDVQRMTWLATVADGQMLIDDISLLSTASPVAMDAADYRGQTGLDVASDCAQASGKNFYCYFNDTINQVGLWYGAEDLTTYSSMIRLTNIAGEVSEAANIYPIGDGDATKLTRDPSRLVSGIYMQYTTGAVYVRNEAMFQHIGLRDQVMSSQNVKTQAKATARAVRYLADLDSEDDRIVTTVRLPAAKVTWIKAGMRIRFKATHLPGYESEVWLRVYRCSVAQDSEESYLLTLEMGTGTVPASPVEAGQSSTALAADLVVGSASFLGLPADQEEDYSRDNGQAAATLVPGKQYRLVVTTIFNRTSVNPDAKTNNGHAAVVTAGGDVVLIAVWDPGSGTNTATLSYDGSAGPSWGLTPTGANTLMDAGDVITGEWIGFDDVATDVDIRIGGDALSGFNGFTWSAHAELQVRDP